ncbi:hypothetical protein SAMN02745885_00018 [Carboxydocella sporoproducens DSM 16521]|uniref:Uncharacterized protein n=2 Tax=Carboxydocella TaxID=178898 RepID=A0A1T4L532_9FIRM|nr:MULTISPECIES: hypothetical protein [Carboxydocella]AVX19968.1 hypothetical protein CFE_0770 [Carboxydocella thermautotrophica]AVX30390.1 hypothetical protein CTH_0788 [Carboxydocella thermautotrophica]SJZ49661.1 hypothetical protein SAMN02745885_00018 [Carboxydocella sporoproducens DSM 16521]
MIKNGFFGFILAVVTVVWHLLHCALPVILPLLVSLGILVPQHWHLISIPWPVTALASIWIIYYLLRQRIIIFYVRK